MSHECPECGMLCHCHGDIDDMQMDTDYTYTHCDHCPPDAEGEDDDYYEVDDKGELVKL